MLPRQDEVRLELQMVGFGDLGRRWGWLLAMGVVLELLGMIAIGASVAITLATMVFIGSLMLVGGMLQIVQAIALRAWSGFYLDLIAGVLYAVFGYLIVSHPGATASALTMVIAALLILGGLFRVLVALVVNYQNRTWLFLHGLVNLLLGMMIWHEWPISGLWVIGMFVGVDMVLNGWSLIMLALIVKKLGADSKAGT